MLGRNLAQPCALDANRAYLVMMGSGVRVSASAWSRRGSPCKTRMFDSSRQKKQHGVASDGARPLASGRDSPDSQRIVERWASGVARATGYHGVPPAAKLHIDGTRSPTVSRLAVADCARRLLEGSRYPLPPRVEMQLRQPTEGEHGEADALADYVTIAWSFAVRLQVIARANRGASSNAWAMRSGASGACWSVDGAFGLSSRRSVGDTIRDAASRALP
jgi:hypothetical protein